MKKKKLGLLLVVIASLVLSSETPGMMVNASEEEGYEDNYEDTEETEPPLPDSYFLPIESNEIVGWPQGPQIEADAAVVMDADTGAFLYSKNMDAREYPASITKIMTALIAIENGNLNSRITFSENAVYNLEEGSSHAGIQVGEIMSMRRALYGLMLESANDIANGIAEEVAGSIQGFSDMMNAKASELGCVNTHFVNPHGLHNEDHYTCARDMALITQEAIKHPTFRKIAGTTDYTCPETNKVDEKRYWYNHNQMIQPEAEYYYEGCLGGKNGFTNDALNTLVTYAKKDGRTLICVEIRVNGKDKAYSESHAMLNYAFENFKNVTVSALDESKTRAQLLGMDNLGETSILRTDELNETVYKGTETTVSIPKNADPSEITKSNNGKGGIDFKYNGWKVGNINITLSPLSYEVPTPKRVPLTYTEIIEETEPGVKGVMQVAVRNTKTYGKKAGEMIVKYAKIAKDGIVKFCKNLPGWFSLLKDKCMELIDWINQNDIMAALVGLILLIILLPILGIAWRRNAKAQKIRKTRKREREERTRIEKDIDSKSVSEIEAELRAYIEKDLQERKQALKEDGDMYSNE